MPETTATETVVTETTNTVEADQSAVTTETDDEYKWLTERLDAHTAELREAKTLLQTAMMAVQESLQPLRTAMEQQTTMNQQLSSMVQTMSETLTALAASAVLRSTPNNSTATLPATETATETVAVVEPENAVEGGPAAETTVEQKRRKRL